MNVAWFDRTFLLYLSVLNSRGPAYTCMVDVLLTATRRAPHSGFLFKLVTYTERRFTDRLLTLMFLATVKGTCDFFFFSPKRKEKRQKPNVVLSDFLIMYSFGDFKFVPLYF